jgi:hypothetical protein
VKGRKHFGDLGINGSKILKFILKEYDARMWTYSSRFGHVSSLRTKCNLVCGSSGGRY